MKLEGNVVSGKKEAQKFLSLKPYKEKIEEKTGFRPYEGTLNLEVDPKKHGKFKQKVARENIEGFNYQGKDYGGLELYQVEIEGVEAALLDINRADHGDEIAEIIAPVKLREKLQLKDGDKVKIHG